MKKYIFVVGGVMSGVGKGITTSAIGKIIQARGFEVTAIKIDPYINVDAGTMNPTEHGEVFVLADGDETDQDMGNYERFLGVTLTRDNYMTTGRVYQSVIQRERNLEFGGECVEVVPDIPLEVIRRIENASQKAKADVTIIEVGGTIGEYQNILFLEAARMMKAKYPDDVAVVLVSYVPIPDKVGEMKTKPTQYAARTLNSAGVQADIIVARAERPLDKKRKEKIATFCSVNEEDVVSAPDVDSIYDVPVNFEKDNLSDIILSKLHTKPRSTDLKEWKALSRRIQSIEETVRIAIVGKYFSSGDFILSDVYISVIEAAKHAGWLNKRKIKFEWVDSEQFEKDPKTVSLLKDFDGVIVPGGFGTRGIEGVITAIRYVREQKIPFLGLCYGMQLAVIEFARNVANIPGATTVEMDPKAKHPVIAVMPGQDEKIAQKNYGGTMRLGAYDAKLSKGSIARKAYGSDVASGRHRHRYEVNPDYIEQISDAGLVFSGKSPKGDLMEIAELPQKDHPFFLGTQYHPELTSSPLTGEPLFNAFIKAAIKKSE